MGVAKKHRHRWTVDWSTVGLRRSLPLVTCECGEVGYQT